MAEISPFCVCTVVAPAALDALLENGTAGTYRDEHPWLAAQLLLEAEDRHGRRLPIVFASGAPLQLMHWAIIRDIEVIEYRRGRWDSQCRFEALAPMHPIWTALDSIMLKPGDDQLRREALEPLPRLRQSLDERHIRPYAICETPQFMMARPATADAAVPRS